MEKNSPQWCGCLSPLTIRQAVGDILAESGELVRVRGREDAMDEISDIAFGVGRLLGAITGRAYVHVPLERRHVRKIEERMRSYGCIRSERHLVNGRCPATVRPESA